MGKYSTKELLDEYVREIKKCSVSGDVYFKLLRNSKRARNVKRKNTGIIDTRRLSNYKTSENIFKRKQIIENETNHGVVILIDFSGSMRKIIGETLKQAAITAEFCKRNNIKFSIILFGVLHYIDKMNYENHNINHPNVYKIADENTFCIEDVIALDPIFIDKIQRDLRETVSSIDEYDKKRIDLFEKIFYMQQTPMIPGLFAAYHIINNYKNLGIYKTHLLIVTDGENNTMDFSYNKNILSLNNDNNVNIIEKDNTNDNSFLTSCLNTTVKIDGYTYEVNKQVYIFYYLPAIILEHINKVFNTNISFSFLLEKREISQSRYENPEQLYERNVIIREAVEIDKTKINNLINRSLYEYTNETGFIKNAICMIKDTSKNEKENEKWIEEYKTKKAIVKAVINQIDNIKYLEYFAKLLAKAIA